ncbi:MAG: BON domain-containing protein, partial [Candidatus Binatia bacterium]
SAGQIVDDAGIVVSIKTAFARDEDISVWDINVDSYDGVVTLYGKVPSRKVGRRAVKIAREVKGVDDVIDRLRVDDG